MKIGFIGAIPPTAVLPEEYILPRYRKSSHPAPWIGGLLPNLAKLSDFQLRIFVPHRAVAKSCVIERDGVEYEGVPSPMLERFAPHTLYYSKSLAVSGAVKRYGPDLIHAFGMENGSATIALRQKVPVSCFIQGIAERLFPYYGHRGFLQPRVAVRCERSAVKRLRWMVAETGFARDWALGHQPDAHVALIPHPLRQEFLGVQSVRGGKRIVSVGGLDARKGMDTVIRAFARIEDQEATLSIVGSGPSLEELKELASTLGVADRVEFPGFFDQAGVMDELSKSSVYVIGSRMDTSPNVLTEAHAAGLPVVGTRAGGIPEMIEDGGDGYHVDVEDDVEMAKKLGLLISDPVLAERFGEAGREKVREENAPRAVAEAHVKFFHRIKSELGC